jgi:6-phosphogluconolactonase
MSDVDLGLPGIVHIEDSAADVAESVASWLARESEEARVEHGYFAVALTGGSTPVQLYRRLTRPPYRDGIAWATWLVFFSDERAVPPDDDESNYHLAHENLLTHVPIPPERVHRMQGERPDIDAAAAEYGAVMADTLAKGPGGAPRLHCALLGIGENGHVASLFPGTPALDAHEQWAVRGLADYEPYDRITLTFPVLNAAESVVIVATGAAKGPALRGVVEGSVPAARVRPGDGTLLWFLDREAAAAMGRGE